MRITAPGYHKLLMGPTIEVRMSSSMGFLKFRGPQESASPSQTGGEYIATAGKSRVPKINMRIGLRKSAQHAGCRVAAEIGHPGVRRFMNADREEKAINLNTMSMCCRVMRDWFRY
jgi:hypothetical protein